MEIFENQLKVIGTKQTLKAIKENKALRVVLAEDTELSIKKTITEACIQQKVALTPYKSKRALGIACGIERSAATIALLK